VAPLLGNMVLLGIHFPTFHKTRDYLEAGDPPGTFSPAKILGAGAAAGAAGSFVSTPTELIRTKMQMVRKNNILAQIKGAAAGAGLNPEENYKGNWDCAKKILRNHGLRGIYSGYVSTLLRDMQGYAWFFFGYEATIHYLAGAGKTKADLNYMQVRTRVRGCVLACVRVCECACVSARMHACVRCPRHSQPRPAVQKDTSRRRRTVALTPARGAVNASCGGCRSWRRAWWRALACGAACSPLTPSSPRSRRTASASPSSRAPWTA
jgi:hypothetical protein